jgi:hypothetical protein
VAPQSSTAERSDHRRLSAWQSNCISWRSDRPNPEHGPTAIQAGLTSTSTDRLTEPGGPIGATDSLTTAEGGMTTSSCITGTSSSINGTSLHAVMEEDSNDDLLDYEPSPACNGIEVNVVYLSSTDYSLLEEEISQLALGSQDTVSKELAELEDHLKPLYIRGHLDGTPVARMLVDGGAMVNVMPYATFKKLGKTDAKLVKTSMTLTSIGGEGPIGPKGVASMELTVGSKMIPTAFFVTEVQGNYNTILGHDWIHANCCVPSTLHQFLIQWVGEEVEIVHADVSACVSTTDSSSWSHYNIMCWSG